MTKMITTSRNLNSTILTRMNRKKYISSSSKSLITKREDWKKRRGNWKSSRRRNRKLKNRDCRKRSKNRMRSINSIKLFYQLSKIKLVKVPSLNKLSNANFWLNFVKSKHQNHKLNQLKKKKNKILSKLKMS